MLGLEVLNELPFYAPGGPSSDAGRERRAMDLDVTIYRHGYLFAVRKGRELSPEGLFVESPPLEVGRRAYLEVEFTLDLSEGTRLYRIPAYIAATRDDGVELQFVDTCRTPFRYVGT